MCLETDQGFQGGLLLCFHSSSLLSAVRYNWWIDGRVCARGCYFCFSYLNSVYEPQSFVVQTMMPGHGNLRPALSPVLPRSCWQMASQSYSQHLPRTVTPILRVMIYIGSIFQEGKMPLVTCQVDRGWVQSAQGQKRMHAQVEPSCSFMDLKIIDKIVSCLRKTYPVFTNKLQERHNFTSALSSVFRRCGEALP